MKYVGIDLHKKVIVLCVVNKDRKVLARCRFHCGDVDGILAFFRALGKFVFVVEATATYEWLVQRLEPLAQSWCLAHPGKLRVIAESTKKSDKLDAQTLAEFLALDLIPKAYRPTPRQREHRVLVRHRAQCRQRVSRLKCQLRHLAATYNLDRRDLFSGEHLEELQQHPDLTAADRFVLEQLLLDYHAALVRHAAALRAVKQFAASASAAEQEQREILLSVPGVGPVVSEIVLAELADANRFGSQKQGTAYAGLVPARRESAGKGKELGITKTGSRLLRWAMVQAAWQAVQRSPRWRESYERIKRRRGAKRAIVAIARRLLGVLLALLRSGTRYRASLAELKEREARTAPRRRTPRTARQQATA